MTTFESFDPDTGAAIGSHPIASAADVAAAVMRGRDAATWWRHQGWDGRRTHLRAWRRQIAQGANQLAEVMHRENGKPVADALLEIMLALDHLAWAGKHAKGALSLRRMRSGWLGINQAALLEYQPLGVVGVIGPWNYPVFTPMGSLAYALAAGNAVVFKPSEYTPGIARWLEQAWREAVPGGAQVMQVVTGLGPTGAALCRAGVDKVAFTGSTATAKLVMAACAENLVPVLIECGGKDAMIVDHDADVAAAADAALWGGMSNAGQTCVGIERVYVAEPLYDRFLDELTSLVRSLPVGPGENSAYGPITMPGQLAVIQGHIADAQRDGGRTLTGGHASASYVEATILVDVPETSAAVQHETFGPILVVTKVRDAEEGLRLTNASRYGLGGAVFAGNAGRGVDLARRMRSGMTSVNSVIGFATVPSLPFGGVGDSGFGRMHGEDGLKEFTRAKAVTRQRFATPVPVLSFSRPRWVTVVLGRALRFLHR
ncbi:MAG: Aldehyde Dehydrogenase [Acidimicrobiia bacterium]|nr:Aldehyde Dehydrogenase [Acidimicrobiia bacterium]